MLVFSLRVIIHFPSGDQRKNIKLNNNGIKIGDTRSVFLKFYFIFSIQKTVNFKCKNILISFGCHNMSIARLSAK